MIIAGCEPLVTQWRSAEVVKVVDGDTLDLKIDLGFDVFCIARIHLIPIAGLDSNVGLDAPEKRGEERPLGLKAMQFVMELLEKTDLQYGLVRVATRKQGSRDKYGRWVGAILFQAAGTHGTEWKSLGDVLIQKGYAERRVY